MPAAVTNWTSEERRIIAEYQVTERPLTREDFRKLQAKLTQRDVQQISDQYRRIVKKDILALYQTSTASSTHSTPSKKRIRKEDSSD